ncbi:MAG TPA: TonB-dependent receptor [Pedomonas sp.]|uniref:TonB-dependent receptor n=1 Tax=Pedomonas sp. TaxID=2976421 RepID=UPI002F40D82D
MSAFVQVLGFKAVGTVARGLLLGGASVAALTLGSAEVRADEAAAATAAMDEIIVTGYQRQNALSILEKRSTDIEADFLSNDETGQQPDYNIADSLRRLPGVDTIFDEDEGRYVAIRGMDPDYTSGAIDGATMGSSERNNRRLNMEAIPSTVVKQAVVRKSRTPDMEGNAIGGYVNLVTRSAFDTNGTYLVGNVFLGHYDSDEAPGSDGLSYRASAAFSTTFGSNDEFGIVAAGSFLRRQRDQERSQPSSFQDLDGIRAPNTMASSAYPLVSKRYGGFLKLEYNPSDSFYAALTGSHFQQDEDELRLTSQVNRRGANVQNGETASTAAGQAFSRYNDFPIEKPMTTVNGNVRWDVDEDSTLDARASWSEAAFTETSNEVRFITPNNDPNLGSTIDVSGKYPVLSMHNPGYFANPANYKFDYFKPYIDDSVETVKEGELNYGWNVGKDDDGWGFKVGTKLRQTTRDMDHDDTTYKLLAGNSLDLSGAYGGTYTPLDAVDPAPIVDYDKFNDFFTANRDLFSAVENNILNDYWMRENVKAAYASATYKNDFMKVVFGMRYEHTRTKVERPQSQTVGGQTLIDIVNHKSSYDNWLPSVTSYFDLTENLRLRASYYKAVGRANPNQLASGEVISTSTDGLLSISRGNPDLEARTADNYSAALEYYFPDNSGLASIGVFHKDVKDDIFTSAVDGEFNGEPAVYRQAVNAAGANVTGLEANLVLNRLDFLPGRLANFGLSTNFTYMKGETEVVMGDGSIRELNYMREQPRRLFNASVFYKEGPFQARVTYAYKSKYLGTINTGGSAEKGDRYYKPDQQLDAQVRFKLNPQVELIAEAKNITDEARVNYEYLDDPAVRDHNYHGRSFWLGASFRL